MQTLFVEGQFPRLSNLAGMDAQGFVAPDTTHILALTARAARVQDLLGDLEVALVPAAETPAMRVLRDLKAAWREFRDEAMRQGAAR